MPEINCLAMLDYKNHYRLHRGLTYFNGLKKKDFFTELRDTYKEMFLCSMSPNCPHSFEKDNNSILCHRLRFELMSWFLEIGITDLSDDVECTEGDLREFAKKVVDGARKDHMEISKFPQLVMDVSEIGEDRVSDLEIY